MQFADRQGRSRSTKRHVVPSTSWHRKQTPIGTGVSQTVRPVPGQKPHPYANALLKRHNDGRQILQNQRLANAPQKMFRAHQHADGMLYLPPANATLGPAALDP